MRTITGRSRGGGIWVAQHHRFEDDGFDLQLRATLLAKRIIGQKRGLGEMGLGHWVEEEGTRGDVHGLQLLSRDTRQIPMWRFATPVIGARPSGEAADLPTLGIGPSVSTPSVAAPPTGVGVECAELDEFNIIPILDKDYNPDERLLAFTPELPMRGGMPVWPKFPRDYIGISLVADRENEQVDLFHPTDPRIISVNRLGDVAMGSLMVDMGAELFIDPTRQAPMQSFGRVIKDPVSACIDFRGQNTIALVINESGCGDVVGGLWADLPQGFTSADGKLRILGAFSQHFGGPLVAGAPGDDHQHGVDDDGNIQTSGHLSTNTLFWRGIAEDAPLLFEGQFVHIAHVPPPVMFNAPFSTPVLLELDPEATHDTPCKTHPGLWKWRAESFFGIPTDDRVPPIGPPTPTGDDSPRAVPRGLESRTYTASIMDIGAPAFLGRPQILGNDGFPDLRSATSVTKETLLRHDSESPVVIRMEAMGKVQDGFPVYTQNPGEETSRFVGGTSDGLMMVMPPEVDAADEINGFSPSNINKSVVTFGILTDNFLGFGLPNPDTGQIKTGYRAGVDVVGDLGFDCVDASGVTVRVLTLTAACKVKELLAKWNFVSVSAASGTTIKPPDFALANASGRNIIIDIEETSATNDGCEVQVQLDAAAPGNIVTIRVSGADTFVGVNLNGLPLKTSTAIVLRKVGESVTFAFDNANGKLRII